MLSILVHSIVVSAKCQANLMHDGPLQITVGQLDANIIQIVIYYAASFVCSQGVAMHAHVQHALHYIPREGHDRCVVQIIAKGPRGGREAGLH